MTTIWKSRFHNKPGDPKYCRASVWDRSSGYRDYQCTRKPVCTRVVDGKEYGFCKQHDPEAVKARDEARHEQWRLAREYRDRQYDREKQTKAALEACKLACEQIRDGHKNPVDVATIALGLFP